MAEGSVRPLSVDEHLAGVRVVATSMLGSLDDDAVQGWADLWSGPGQTHGAFSAAGEQVGVARWFRTSLSIPGGAVDTACVTAVAVLSTHRRQGHLRRLMEAQLEHIAAAGVPVALLVAAEWPIYGRFGYGPAVEACGWEVDARAAQFLAPREGTVELVSLADLRPYLEAVHDQRWSRTPGAVVRESAVFDVLAGLRSRPGDALDASKLRGAVWRDGSGAVQGAVAYKVVDTFTRNRPDGRAEVTLLVGATPEAERELWRHLCELDWVTTVTAGNRSVDDPLPLFLDDGRAAVQVDRFDCIWARVLDLPAACARRTSPVEGHVVIDVDDHLGYTAGRWALSLGPAGGSAEPTTAAAEIRLPARALGAAYLGGTSIGRLHEAGWVEEVSTGSAARLGSMLATPTAPWSPTTY